MSIGRVLLLCYVYAVHHGQYCIGYRIYKQVFTKFRYLLETLIKMPRKLTKRERGFEIPLPTHRCVWGVIFLVFVSIDFPVLYLLKFSLNFCKGRNMPLRPSAHAMFVSLKLMPSTLPCALWLATACVQ